MSYIMSMTSPTEFCHMTQIILWMWSCDQRLVTSISIREVIITSILFKDLTRKTAFLRSGLGLSSITWDWH